MARWVASPDFLNSRSTPFKEENLEAWAEHDAAWAAAVETYVEYRNVNL